MEKKVYRPGRRAGSKRAQDAQQKASGGLASPSPGRKVHTQLVLTTASSVSPPKQKEQEKKQSPSATTPPKATDTNQLLSLLKKKETPSSASSEVIKKAENRNTDKENRPASPLRNGTGSSSAARAKSPKRKPPETSTRPSDPKLQKRYALGRPTTSNAYQSSIRNYTSSYAAAERAWLLGYSHIFSTPSGKAEGFKNLGNTCYMNAVLQAVLSFDSFVADMQINAGVLQPFLRSNSFCVLLLDVAKKMRRTNHGVLDLKLLKSAIDQNLKGFAGWAQQDAHEFFGSCLTQLEEELARIKRDVNKGSEGQDAGESTIPQQAVSPDAKRGEEEEKELEQRAILDSLRTCHLSFFSALTCPTILNFSCVVRHEYWCSCCDRCSVVNETCRELSLELTPRVLTRVATSGSSTPSVNTILKAFFAEEEVARTCSRCQSTTAKASHKFLRLPRILVIHLKRFRANADTKGVDKLSDAVKIEKDLNIDFACNRYTFNPTTGEKYQPEPPQASKGKEKEKPTAEKSKNTTSTSKGTQLTIADDDNDLDNIILGPSESLLQRAMRISKKEFEQEREEKKKQEREVFAFDSQNDSPELAKAMQMSLRSFQEEETKRKEEEEFELALAQSMAFAADEEGLEKRDTPKRKTPETNGNGDADEAKGDSPPAEKRRRFAKRKRLEPTPEMTKGKEPEEEEQRHESEALHDRMCTESGPEEAFALTLERSPRQATLLYCDDDFISGEEPEEPNEPFDSRYHLRCIVVHKGKAASAGHYIADVFDSTASLWKSFDDARVTEISETALLGEERERNGYLLFYIHHRNADM